MITCTFKKNRITASGHAGYAPEGQDIVCAGVSMLMFACAATAQQNGSLVAEEFSPGKSMFECTDESILSVAKTGLKLLAENYPENIFTEGEK